MYLLDYSNRPPTELSRSIDELLGEFDKLKKNAELSDTPRKPLGELSAVARETLRELNGEKSWGPSYSAIYSTKINEAVRRDVAQAMALADREFGLIDEIALRIIEGHFERFVGPVLRTALEFSQPPSKDLFDFEHLRKVVLQPFLDPGSREGLSINFNLFTGDSPVMLQLTTGLASRRVYWDLRGSSKLKPTHRKLLKNLRAASEDFQTRLQWRDEYPFSTPLAKPGLNAQDIGALRTDLKLFFKQAGAIDLRGLKPEVSSSDEPIVLDPQSRGFIGRCERCQQIVKLELLTDLSLRDSSKGDWTRAGLYRSSIVEDHFQPMFSRIHQAMDCGATHYVSSRTGSKEPIAAGAV